MAGIFETVTRSAIAELISAHCSESKYGFVLSQEAFNELTDELYEFLMTSRNLKAAGDRLLAGGASAVKPREKPGGRF